jgi:hypothetical protein
MIEEKHFESWGPKLSKVMDQTTGTAITSSWEDGDAYGYHIYQFKHLMGRLLTIVEATGLNEKQEKAVKDVIRNALSEFTASTFYMTGQQVAEVKKANEDMSQSSGIQLG